MGRLEEYNLWKKGRLNKKMSNETIAMFEAIDRIYDQGDEDALEDLIINWDEYDKKTLLLYIISILVYGLFGFLIGLTAGVR